MVTRKPVPGNMVPTPLQRATNNPPYPTSPTIPSQHNDMHPGYGQTHGAAPSQPFQARTRSRSSSQSSTDTWNSGTTADDDTPEDDMPAPLHIASKDAGLQKTNDELPAALRAGPPNASLQQPHPDEQAGLENQQRQWADQNPLTPQPVHQSHNPYHNLQRAGQSTYGTEPSQSIWADAPPQPQTVPPPPPPPAELPTVHTLNDEMSKLSFNNTPDSSLAPPYVPYPGSQSLNPIQADTTGRSIDSQRSQTSNPWQDDLDREQRRSQELGQNIDGGAPSLLDEDPIQAPFDQAEEIPPPKPPRPAAVAISQPQHANIASPSEPETPSSQAKRQRNEFYHIKHVNWYDASAVTGRGKGSVRRSPILTQNANGPCPLLALVNVLSLSTPANEETALTQTLQTREQVTLGLLLDAVFEELVRRNEHSGHDLPDIGDLYSFLITLHTGMNVNPRFAAPTNGTEDVTSQGQLGTFEETREMRLYSTFDIPLIHGWTVASDSSTYAAFKRSAQTFEDAQNIQFQEEELEEKLRSQGLTSDEQQMFDDVTAVKRFLANYPTQLTDYGLDLFTKFLKPGQLAILFRNDHFSTLYKEPATGALMTLVTDAGYSTHDEIVWESLVDINGAASELFSGDFRQVGTTTSSEPVQPNVNAYTHTDAGWQTVQSRSQHNPRNAAQGPQAVKSLTQPATDSVPSQQVDPSDESSRKAAEQEDHDLALALQLQEEEEDSHRREAAARRQREENLSRQFLDREQPSSGQPVSSQLGNGPPQIPPRNRRANSARPAGNEYQPPSGPPPPPAMNASARTDEDGVPPPTYEEAASDRPYRPPGSTPARQRQGDPLGALGALEAQRQQSAFAQQSSLSVNSHATSPGNNRRRSSGFGAPVGNRMRRAHSQGQGPGLGSMPAPGGGSGDRMPGTYNGPNLHAAPENRMPEQKDCVVM